MKNKWSRKWLKKGVKAHVTAVIDDDVQIGEGTVIWHFTHICEGAIIGTNCSLGQNVFVDRGVHVGNDCRVGNNVSIWRGVTLEDEVSLRPGCMLTNDRVPVPKQNFVPGETIIRRGAVISSGAIIICGDSGGPPRIIGARSLVGAGAIVDRDVFPGMVIVGFPGCYKEFPLRADGTFLDGVYPEDDLPNVLN